MTEQNQLLNEADNRVTTEELQAHQRFEQYLEHVIYTISKTELTIQSSDVHISSFASASSTNTGVDPQIEPPPVELPKQKVNLSYQNLNRVPYNIALDTQVLDISHNQLTSLEGVERLENLEEIYCSYNQITHFAALRNLPKLQKIECNFNFNGNRPTLNDMSGLPASLRRLYIENCQLSDRQVQTIGPLPNLLVLNMTNNQLTTLVDNLPPNIVSLKLPGNQIRSISSRQYRYFTRLIIFDCSRNQLTKLNLNIEDTWLYKLDCQNNPNLTSLTGLPDKLAMLSAGGTALTRLTKLPQYISLLNCNESKAIDNLNLQLDNLPYLSLLSLNCTFINSSGRSGQFPRLHPKAQLTVLKADNCGIDELPDVSNQQKLTTLYISGGPTRQVVIGQLPQTLTELTIIGGQSVQFFATGLPPALQKLLLVNCSFLRDLPSLAQCHSLQQLILVGNTGLTYLPELPGSLSVLNCSNCTALTYIPKLPQGLLSFNCANANLTELPELPGFLVANGTIDISCNNFGTGQGGYLSEQTWTRILAMRPLNRKFSPQREGPLEPPVAITCPI